MCCSSCSRLHDAGQPGAGLGSHLLVLTGPSVVHALSYLPTDERVQYGYPSAASILRRSVGCPTKYLPWPYHCSRRPEPESRKHGFSCNSTLSGLASISYQNVRQSDERGTIGAVFDKLSGTRQQDSYPPDIKVEEEEEDHI